MGIDMSVILLEINENSHPRNPWGDPSRLAAQSGVLVAHACHVSRRTRSGESHGTRAPGLRVFSLCRSHRSKSPSTMRGGLAPWQVQRVQRYIEKACCSRINIDELARLTRLSSSYFSVAFRVSFGTSPHDYISRHRVDRAKHLMKTTQTPLCDIALQCASPINRISRGCSVVLLEQRLPHGVGSRVLRDRVGEV